jgi:hypothetical protein
MTIDFEVLDFLVWKAHGISCLRLMQFVWVILDFTAFVTCYNFFSRSSGFPKVRIDSSEQITFFLGILFVVNFFFDTMFAQKFVALWSLGTAM